MPGIIIRYAEKFKNIAMKYIYSDGRAGIIKHMKDFPPAFLRPGNIFDRRN